MYGVAATFMATGGALTGRYFVREPGKRSEAISKEE